MDQETLLRKVYAAFNAREMETILGVLHADIRWSNGMEGGFVQEREAVRDYWTRQWRRIDPYVEPGRFTLDGEGRMVRDLAGNVIVDQMVASFAL